MCNCLCKEINIFAGLLQETSCYAINYLMNTMFIRSIKLNDKENPHNKINNYLFNEEKINSLKSPRKELIKMFFHNPKEKVEKIVVDKIEQLINHQSDRSTPSS